jgi:transposase
MKRKPRKKDVSQVAALDSLKRLNLNAAGLDIGADAIYACVPQGRDAQTVRVFKTFTCDLNALADWLEACGIDTVAMESTGVYWIPVYEILESRGLEVCLVNARHVKKFAGRKTDVLDCQWLWQLHTYGLLKGSFRPPDEIVALRGIARQRDTLIGDRSRFIQRMQKALTQMNVRLTSVVSDITGVTGLAIIRAILRGERDPQQLAALRNEHCAKSEEEIARALEGNWRAEHLFALKQAVEFYDYFNQQIAACDEELEARYAAFEPRVDLAEKPLQPLTYKPRREGNTPAFDLRTYLYQMAGVDLCQIDGIKALSAHNILSEIGLDMSNSPYAMRRVLM